MAAHKPEEQNQELGRSIGANSQRGMGGGRECAQAGSLLSSSPRKFNIPGYSRTLRWKAVDGQYWCVSPSVTGPIATLDPAVGSVPPRMKVYESLHDKYDSRPMLVHHGVSLLLLDYLVITALLLVTEMKDVGRHETDRFSALVGPSFLSISTSALPWTKLMSRDTIFRKRASARTSTDNLPLSSTSSVGQMAKIVYGDPIYPTLSPVEPDSSSADSDSERDDESDTGYAETDGGMVASGSSMRVPSSSRAPSPSKESICYPLRNASAPSHTYIDPSYYADPNAPPVPSLPSEYNVVSPSSSSSHHERSIPRVSSAPPSPKVDPPKRAASIALWLRFSHHVFCPRIARFVRWVDLLTALTGAAFSPANAPTGAAHTTSAALRKDSRDDLSGWLLMGSPHSNASGSRITVMELPPPPYNSIDFAVPEDAPPPAHSLRPLPPAPTSRPVPQSCNSFRTVMSNEILRYF
ncbi:hypothetical protein CPB85DRAFT_1251415 [Mucidula mucida]|nr:hypothetical protein CPB85DRAFT_1251415 [Mucidula mucida]